MSRTEISELGEFGLIDKIKKIVPISRPDSVFGIGDDAAVIKPNPDHVTLFATDMMVEGIHFDLSYTPLQHLGYKLVATNVSDICAMNGIPTHATVSLALSNRFSVEAVEAFYDGIRAASIDYQIDIVGGDSTSSPKGLVASLSILGNVKNDRVSYRKNAKKGDIVCVTGDLGAAYVGLQILRREKEVYLIDSNMIPELENKEYVIKRQLKPIARLDVIHEFAELRLTPTAMIDVSDGLASDLLHICTQSGVGAHIFEDKLPVDAQTLETMSELHLSPTACLLNGGEDYELLFAIRPEDFDKIKNHPDITPIGYITDAEGGCKLVTTENTLVDIKAQGWVHF